MIRFTKDIIPKVLEANEGFKKSVCYISGNCENEAVYTITGKQLVRESVGKTSCVGSMYDCIEVCDYKTTQRFLRNNIAELNLDI